MPLFALEPNKRGSVPAPPTMFALELNERESVPVPPTKPSFSTTTLFALEQNERSALEQNEDESELSPPPKKLKGLIRRRNSIGRRKDGRQKKPGSYDYASVRVSHGLHFTA